MTRLHSNGGVPHLLAVVSRNSVVEEIAETLFWAQTSRRLRRMPLATRVELLTRMLERHVRRSGRRKAERQMVDFYCRSQQLFGLAKTETETDTNTAAASRRYSVSWPVVRQMLVGRIVEAWGYDATDLSREGLEAADLKDKREKTPSCSSDPDESELSDLADSPQVTSYRDDDDRSPISDDIPTLDIQRRSTENRMPDSSNVVNNHSESVDVVFK